MAKYDQHMLTTASIEGTEPPSVLVELHRRAETKYISATENFLDNYYVALQGSRHTIASYFCPFERFADGKELPGMVWNGNVFRTPEEYQALYEDRMPFTHYEVQSFDCHVLNPTAMAPDKLKGGSGEQDKDIEKRMSIVVLVSGTVRLDEPKTGPLKQFSETFVLVPNPEKTANGPKSVVKAWVIQNMNFRFVV
ncbi:NTF2-like protein [Mytilinidion resinicola]|uniref:NTF2-like protein n=1 Tax=Mytilinidion resinicola TaxID=574789 RepID=A0A6A6YNS5_9PEZI|nr:NTF2-like protein [Mytilinidion resinicola]KAF2810391.1 NTF2-like protein [Mytilinidion resinicola]